VKKINWIAAMRAMGDENRLRIIRLLMKGKLSVTEIGEAVGLTQYNVSKNLRILREAGLVEQEKYRQQRLYSLAADFTEQLAENKNLLDLGCCQFDFTKLEN
jgi:DNA-binding transcriptional ArsR family regulator